MLNVREKHTTYGSMQLSGIYLFISAFMEEFFSRIFVLLTYESNLGNYIDFLCDILGIYILLDSPLIGKS